MVQWGAIGGETPPRMWGRHKCLVNIGGIKGNTPTHVGKTSPTYRSELSNEKHPHACGEDTNILVRAKI